ncbi:hypothetical protein VNI00_009096 [Paramarasmius palmivorus]|uniref:Mid2 domain-containing protein n=1 Tax=Paramarasmius palmivorus TaxID=297713 RepID=A0AAW0CP58_9AGAR
MRSFNAIFIATFISCVYAQFPTNSGSDDFNQSRDRAQDSFNKAALGIGIGVGVSLLISLIVVIWAVMRHRKIKQWQRNYVMEAQARAQMQQPPQYTTANQGPYAPAAGHQYAPPHV